MQEADTHLYTHTHTHAKAMVGMENIFLKMHNIKLALPPGSHFDKTEKKLSLNSVWVGLNFDHNTFSVIIDFSLNRTGQYTVHCNQYI